jgi:phosphoribosyl-AMP cyclohydrolase
MQRVEDLLRNINFEKGGGLVPVIVQDAITKEILMLGYANREALLKTIETGYAHFWSRSRDRLWMKGETSGNLLKVEEILIDCDGDSIIYIAKPSGPICHTGNKSCFFKSYRIFTTPLHHK